MVKLLFRYVLILLWLTDSYLSNSVQQTPLGLIKQPEESVQLNCSHSVKGYERVLWYQKNEHSFTFLGYLNLNYENPEDHFKNKIKLLGDGRNNAKLVISNLTSADSARYFCAASSRQGGANPAYFGDGTKLTVLEPGIEITPPNVKVLPPSGQELCKTKSVTLVCVATRFYPDHINVIWQLNGKDAKNYVTDNRALWDDNNKTYSITSRLKVLSKQWFNTKNKFTCLTSFYNGEKNLENQDTIQGVEGGGMNIEYIKKSGLTAKLSYGVLLFKSFGYGLFVFAVVWKLRGSAKKRNN